MQKDIDVLEKVQKRLIRSLSDKKGDEYAVRLKNAGLTTLEDRRRRGDQIQYRPLRQLKDLAAWILMNGFLSKIRII